MFETVVGQLRIIKELSSIVSNVVGDKNLSLNILLRGKAGSGKTMIARLFLSYCCPLGYTKQTPAIHGNKFIFTPDFHQYRGHFIDEIHTVSNTEQLYPVMDAKKYIVCLASNESGVLPEALTSRCFVYSLDDYTQDEIVKIILNYSDSIDFPMTPETAAIIADKCRLSPRLAKLYIERIKFLVNSNYYKKTLNGIKTAFKDIGVLDGGYTVYDIRYLRFLADVGKASIDTISKSIGIDRQTIVNEIEPFLLMRGHIQITRGGRVFIQWQQL